MRSESRQRPSKQRGLLGWKRRYGAGQRPAFASVVAAARVEQQLEPVDEEPAGRAAVDVVQPVLRREAFVEISERHVRLRGDLQWGSPATADRVPRRIAQRLQRWSVEGQGDERAGLRPVR